MTKPTDTRKGEGRKSQMDERVKLDMAPEEALRRLLRTPPARPEPKK